MKQYNKLCACCNTLFTSFIKVVYMHRPFTDDSRIKSSTK